MPHELCGLWSSLKDPFGIFLSSNQVNIDFHSCLFKQRKENYGNEITDIAF